MTNLGLPLAGRCRNTLKLPRTCTRPKVLESTADESPLSEDKFIIPSWLTSETRFKSHIELLFGLRATLTCPSMARRDRMAITPSPSLNVGLMDCPVTRKRRKSDIRLDRPEPFILKNALDHRARRVKYTQKQGY
jgi:hypothetical protein